MSCQGESKKRVSLFHNRKLTGNVLMRISNYVSIGWEQNVLDINLKTCSAEIRVTGISWKGGLPVAWTIRF